MARIWELQGDYWFNIETGKRYHKSLFWWLDSAVVS